MQALALLTEWWGQSPIEYMRELDRAGLESMFGELEGWATQSKGYTHNAENTRVAKTYYAKVKALRPEGGWK